jgi:hypothetical protein
MQKNTTLLLLSAFLAFFNPAQISATTETEVTDSLKERLKETLSNTPTANEIIATRPNRAYIGMIKDVIQKTLIIETKDGKRQVVLTDDTTIIRTPGNATIKADSLRIDDYLIAIGTPKDENSLTGIRLIASTNSLTNTTKKTGYGQITKLTATSLTLSNQDQELALTINNKTIIKTKSESNLKISDLQENSRIIYTAEKDLATVLMIIN